LRNRAPSLLRFLQCFLHLYALGNVPAQSRVTGDE